MVFEFNDIFSLIYISFELLFVVFLLTAKSKKRLSNLILIAFLIVDMFDSGGQFYAHLYLHYPSIMLLISELVYLKLPLLYLYVLSVIYKDFHLKYSHLIHLIPYVLITLIFYPEYYSLTFEEKITALTSSQFNDFISRKLSYLGIHIQLIVYYILIFKVIAYYKKLLEENYSNIRKLNHTWLFLLTLIFAVIAIVATIKNILLFFSSSLIFGYAQSITSFVGLISVAILVIKALSSAELFIGVNMSLKTSRELLEDDNKKHDFHPQVNSEDNDQEIQELKRHIRQNKPYLNSDLSLFDLATQLNVNSRELSILINHKLGLHFYDFINQYRIDEAKALLKDKSKNFTIQQILYEVGFNSKSSFNTAFKKYTGITPTEYRKSA